MQDVGDAGGEIDGGVVGNAIDSEIESGARGRNHIRMKLSVGMGGKGETQPYRNERPVF